MGKLLMVGTYGTDEATRATMPFIAASGALDRGHQPAIALMGESVHLLNDHIAAGVNGVGFPPLSELWAKMVKHEVPIFV